MLSCNLSEQFPLHVCTCPTLCVSAGQKGLLLQTQGPCQRQGMETIFQSANVTCCSVFNYCMHIHLYIEPLSQRSDPSVSFQRVTGKGFEVCRRVYVDFEGINLRRKFLTGLEPESINMTIGNYLNVFCCFFQ